MTVAPLVITGMGGKTNMEQFQIDQVVDQLSDLFTETVKALFEKDETRKVSMMIIIYLFYFHQQLFMKLLHFHLQEIDVLAAIIRKETSTLMYTPF